MVSHYPQLIDFNPPRLLTLIASRPGTLNHPSPMKLNLPRAQTFKAPGLRQFNLLRPWGPRASRFTNPQIWTLPKTMDTSPRPIINVHYPQHTTTHTICHTCGSQIQEGDEDGGTEDTDEGFYSRPEERAQLRFRRLSQALKLDDDTNEEDEAGGGHLGCTTAQLGNATTVMSFWHQ